VRSNNEAAVVFAEHCDVLHEPDCSVANVIVVEWLRERERERMTQQATMTDVVLGET